MQNILILNGAMQYGESKGKLNLAFVQIMQDEFKKLGKSVEITHIANGYESKSEVAKWVKADCVIWQFPGWWMNYPWIVKKYIDEVLYTDAFGVLVAGDGRSRSDASAKYGSGGLCQGKAMMISTTWNAPKYAFNQSGEFFDARGVDEVFTHLYKIHKFLGFTYFLPSFTAFDVIKNPNFAQYEADLREHIRKNFGENLWYN